MVILTLNCGSSSAKYQVYDWDNKAVLASGIVERVTQPGSVITHKVGKNKDVVEFLVDTRRLNKGVKFHGSANVYIPLNGSIAKIERIDFIIE